jgi:membrane associated rhomboid family serine protease
MADPLARILNLPAPDLLIGSVAVVTVWGWLFTPLQRALVLIPFRVRYRGEVHRLATAGWVHVGLVHLLCNMFTLHFFAWESMHILGLTRFLFLYLTAVVVSFIPTTLRHQNDPGYASLGASGAVMAVVFSAILLNPKLRLDLLVVSVPGVLFAAFYLAYSISHSLSSTERVNHDAHAAGAIYGALLSYLFEPTRVERSLRILRDVL